MVRRVHCSSVTGSLSVAIVLASAISAAAAPVVPSPSTEPRPRMTGDDPRRAITIELPPPSAVVDAGDLAPFFDAARVRRVDVIGISDSNQIHHGVGWDQGFNVALAERFTMYATPLVSSTANGITQGYRSGAAIFPAQAPTESPLPPQLDSFWSLATAVVPSGASNLAPGSSFGPSQLGVSIEAGSPIDPTGPLRFYFSYGTYPIDGGGFRAQFRHDGPASYGGWAQGDWISSYNPVGYEMRVATLDIPAGSRGGNNVYAGYSRQAGAPILGPLFTALMRAENVGHTSGLAYSSLIYDAGESLRTMAARLISMQNSQLQYYFTELMRQQNSPDKMLLVCINSGFNDPNEVLPSLGPGQFTDPYSGAAYADNLRALMTRITEAWTACGFDPDGLYFLIFPSHPPPPFHFDHYFDPYRSAAGLFAGSNPRTASVDLSRLIDWEELAARQWYYFSTIDTYHLSTAGYEGLSRMLLQALLGPVLPGDVTADGRVDLGDISDVIAHWGEASAAWLAGDANGDGLVTLEDLARVIDNYGR